MNTSRSIARWLGIALLVVAGLAVVAIGVAVNVDHGYLRDDAERMLSRALGRTVNINGPLHLTVGRTVRLSVSEVQIASADWTDQPDLLHIGQMSAALNASSLLADELEFYDLTIENVKAWLEVDTERGNNWTFDRPPADAKPSSAAPRPRVPVRFTKLRVSDAEIIYRSPTYVAPIHVRIDELEQDIAADERVNLQIAGLVNDTPVKVHASVNSIERLNEFSGVDFEMDGQLGEIEFAGDLQFEDLLQPGRPTADMRLTGPDIQYLARILKLPDVESGPMDVQVELQPEQQLMRLHATAHLGRLEAELAGRFDDLRTLDDVTLGLSVKGHSAGRLGRLLGVTGFPEAPFKIHAELQKALGVLDMRDAKLTIGDTQATAVAHFDDFPRLSSANATIDVTGQRIEDFGSLTGLHDELRGPFLAKLSLTGESDNKAKLQLNAQDRASRLAVSGTVTDRKGLADSRFKLNYATDNLSNVSSIAGKSGVPALPARIDASLLRREHATTIESATLRLAEDTVTIMGEVSDQAMVAGTELQVEVLAADLLRSLQTFGIDAGSLPREALQANGHLSVKDGTLILSDFNAGYAGIRLDGNAEIARFATAPRDSISARINARSDDINHAIAGLDEAGRAGAMPMRLALAATLEAGQLQLSTLDLKLGDSSIVASGLVNGPPVYAGTSLNFVLEVPDTGKLASLAGQDLPGHALNMKFHVAGSKDAFTIDDLAMQLGNSDISGRLQIRASSPPEVSLDLHSESIDVTPYLARTEDAQKADAPAAQPDKRLIPDTPLRYAFLEKADVSFNTVAEHVVSGVRDLSDVRLHGKVQNGTLTIDEFSLAGEQGGRLRGAATYGPAAEGAFLRLAAVGENLELGLPAATEEERRHLPRYSLGIGLESQGATAREMAAALNGYARLHGGAGRLRAGTMRLFTQDFLSELLNTVNPFMKQDPYSNVECSAILVKVADGRLSGNPLIVVQSDRLKILVRTMLNLADEKLDADINTVPRKGLGLSLSNLVNPYIKVQGTLAEPVLAIDKQSTLIEGGAAIATGGISILAKGLFDRMSAVPDPCRKALDDSRQAFELLEQKYGGGLSVN